jgi:hypothetical protein
MIKAPTSRPAGRVGTHDARMLPDLDSASVNISFFSAGHSVSATTAVGSTAELVAQIRDEYADAVATTRELVRVESMILR